MYKTGKIFILLVIGLFLASWSYIKLDATNSYKCLVQLTNYKGEGAYMVVSLINPQGNYEKTLYVMGKDAEWYPDLKEWWSFFNKKTAELDGMTGATIGGGERTMCVIQVDDSKLDAGYKLRFETAVEDQKYYVKDLEIPLTSANVKGKFEGQGYIRYIRLMPN